MKKLILIMAILFIPLASRPSFTQEKLEVLDGYWWGTIDHSKKAGYILGFIDGNMKGIIYSLMDIAALRLSKEELEELLAMDSEWTPFDHSPKFYIERIDGYYKTTKDMARPVNEIMYDLMKKPINLGDVP